MRDAPLFLDRYRVALLDYLAGNGETGLACAYELGRSFMGEGYGLLQIVHVHGKAMNAILDSAQSADEGVRRVKASVDFLMEALSTFDMASRGYLAQLDVNVRERQSNRERDRKRQAK